MKNKLNHLSLFIAIILMLSITCNASGGLPVFPKAQGFGTETPAGRFGTVYKVSNLNDTGSGTLRECVEASVPRVCVFEVAGIIELTSEITIRDPYITIAGQTAPSPGITIKGAGVRVYTHDVLLQHIRIRVGDNPVGPEPANRDGLGIEDSASNIVVDHCSISWAIDENVALWGDGTHDITISNTIISEALNDSIHPDGPHSMGLLIGHHVRNVSIIRNLFAHNYGRNPLIQGSTSTLIVNNIIYDVSWQAVSVSDSTYDGPIQTSIVGSVVIPGLSGNSPESTVTISEKIIGGTEVYVKDNDCELKTDDPLSCVKDLTNLDVISDLPPIWVTNLLVEDVSNTKNLVLENAGARPADRDSVDLRIVNNTLNISGRIIDSQNDVGGWPNIGMILRPLELPSNPSSDDNGDGYTNLEEWLHNLAGQVEGSQAFLSPPNPPVLTNGS